MSTGDSTGVTRSEVDPLDVEPERQKPLPKNQKQQKSQTTSSGPSDNVDRYIFDSYIDVIASVPFSKTPDGRKILSKLRSLNNQGKVQFDDQLDSAGAWEEQSGIAISGDYRNKDGSTCADLVHEAAHAVWSDSHPKGKYKARSMEKWGDPDEEFFAWKAQLEVYMYLSVNKQIDVPDSRLDDRLKAWEYGADDNRLKATMIDEYRRHIKVNELQIKFFLENEERRRALEERRRALEE